MTVKKRIEISVLLALLFSALLSAVKFEANCLDLKQNILRLHVVANSDSEFDQQLKLKVRDAVLKESENIFSCAKNKEEAFSIARKNTEKFANAAKKVILKSGKNYAVTVKTENTYFPTKEYENFTLPAGYYDAMCVTLGKGEGHNWWCVLFPEVCLSAASDISENLSKNTADTIAEPKKYRIEFKAAEVYNEIKNKLFSMFS